MTTIKPKHDWLLVKREHDVERKMGSVIIPSQHKPRFFVWGLVEAIGPGMSSPTGKHLTTTIQVGDRILYPKGSIKAELGMELFDDVHNNYDMVQERSVVGYVRSGVNKFVPLFNNVIGKVIKNTNSEKVLDSGLILFSSTVIRNKRDSTDMVKIETVETGPGRRTEKGIYIPTCVLKGDKCLVNVWDAWEFSILPNDPFDYVIVRDDEILALVDE